MRDPEAVQRMKEAVDRNVKAITLRPSVGQGTAVTKVRIRDACTAEIEDGGWKLVADESVKDGGNGEGPDPGVFGRVALAYSRMDDSIRDSAHAEYLDSIAPYRDGAAYNVAGEFVVAMGWKR